MTDPFDKLRHKQIFPFRDVWPRIAESAYIAPGAMVIGDVEIGAESGLWFNVVVRGDVNHVRIGARTNIQDGTIVHVDRRQYPAIIGDDVTVGHNAVIHACTLEDRAFVGIKATVMDGCVVEGGGMVAAGALLTPGKRVRTGELWAGVPARHIRKLTDDEKAWHEESVSVYIELARTYRAALGKTGE